MIPSLCGKELFHVEQQQANERADDERLQRKRDGEERETNYADGGVEMGIPAR